MERKERLKKAMKDEAEVLSRNAERIDYEIMSKITDILGSVKRKGKKVVLAGCGTAGQAAKRIAHTLCVVEVPSFFLSPADSIHGGMGVMQEGDVLILISKSGNTQEILNYLPAAQKKGLTVIGVTENESSKLGRAADIVLKIKIDREPDCWGLVSSASTLAFISAFDAMAFAIMEENGYTKEEFYLIHTGGGVGDILRKEL
ncbi:MAG: SIS domain-containing protein [Lachnospiraceae bacterium]|jgi:arabinose-5-phosphate isomerase|uniref:SIS domain-containing protein n=1 Tax=Candidatus Merdisoma sp. JLR.KK006 TaxID=3112626 RepID=UPI002FF41E7C|nr:SIS domain-containing protein [Lachnospiraceae bacterium]